MNSFADVWASVLSQLKNDLSETTFSAWFDELEAVDMQGTTFVLYCPNAFKKDFIESLNEVITVTEKDSPEDAQLKRDVIAARLELKDAMDRGEDIEQIMLDTRKELQRLMVAKMQLKKLFYDERKKCKTEEDVDDLLGACNKMLEEKGIAPISYGPITKRNILRSQNSQQ